MYNKLMPSKVSRQNTTDSLSSDWLIKNTLGLFFGFVVISLVGLIYSIIISSDPTLKISGYAVIFAGILQGTILGEWQAKALQRRFPKLNSINWIVLTAIASGLIWFSIIALPFAKVFPAVSQETAKQSLVYAQAAKVLNIGLIFTSTISFLAGLFLGYIVSFLQWLELGRHVKASFGWIFYSSLAWALGFSSIIILLTELPYTTIFSLILSAFITFLISSFIISAVSLLGVLALKKK